MTDETDIERFIMHPQAERPAWIPPPAARPTAQQHFDAMTRDEQDAAFGPAAAEMIRSGEARLADFVEVAKPGDGAPGFIRQRPVGDLEN